MRILIVDDEDDVRSIASLSLGDVGGMEVTDVSNGPDAIAYARAHHPDAILLDVMMPGMDGPTTIAALKADPETRDIPVVFLTAKVMETEIERLIAAGAAGVVTKPFDPMKLADQVRNVLARSAG